MCSWCPAWAQKPSELGSLKLPQSHRADEAEAPGPPTLVQAATCVTSASGGRGAHECRPAMPPLQGRSH